MLSGTACTSQPSCQDERFSPQGGLFDPLLGRLNAFRQKNLPFRLFPAHAFFAPFPNSGIVGYSARFRDSLSPTIASPYKTSDPFALGLKNYFSFLSDARFFLFP